MGKEFETFCRRCGRKILMIQNERDGRWVPCDTEIRRYRHSGGPFTFVDVCGILWRGERTFSGDPAGEWGYQKHRTDCAEVNAV